jgi:hypothetical protein
MLKTRQTKESNIKRSTSYKKTASIAKTSGHKTEVILAERLDGSVIHGTQKSDCNLPKYGNTSVKKGKKLQLSLYTIERLEKDLGLNNPYVNCARNQRDFYFDRHFNNGNLTKSLNQKAEQSANDLKDWLNNDIENFILLLDYVLTNFGEVNYLADLFETDNKLVYMTKMTDVLELFKKAKPIAKVTPSGLRLSISANTSKGRRAIFSLEVRSDITHCKSMLFKAESKWFFDIIRQSSKCQSINL